MLARKQYPYFPTFLLPSYWPKLEEEERSVPDTLSKQQAWQLSQEQEVAA